MGSTLPANIGRPSPRSILFIHLSVAFFRDLEQRACLQAHEQASLHYPPSNKRESGKPTCLAIEHLHPRDSMIRWKEKMRSNFATKWIASPASYHTMIESDNDSAASGIFSGSRKQATISPHTIHTSLRKFNWSDLLNPQVCVLPPIM